MIKIFLIGIANSPVNWIGIGDLGSSSLHRGHSASISLGPRSQLLHAGFRQVHADRVEQLLAHQDGRLEADRQRDRVRGTAVEDPGGLPCDDAQGSIVDAGFERDDDLRYLGVERLEDGVHQVVRERARGAFSNERALDGFGDERIDENRNRLVADLEQHHRTPWESRTSIFWPRMSDELLAAFSPAADKVANKNAHPT